ncbi:hypothetical protein CERSUDRAFT_90222 [Gelatoporia subvermispora B]|uniref:Uncharacterized protein n=1 Tax=Ceriporiopsis subvermispora (strain B) TaxID=914234 RepID=M2QWY9_CERS8|nr:hypothetical protein CERSUDRAFT_90222 [Gelatoporia subvermispora B]
MRYTRIPLITLAISVANTEIVSAAPNPAGRAIDLVRRQPIDGIDTLNKLFGAPHPMANNLANNEAAIRQYTNDQSRAMQVAQHSAAATQAKTRRAQDFGTAGGNAYTGSTSSVSGGSVVNIAPDDATISNDAGSNQAASAGTTESGIATGGNGDGFGPGGNAYSGSSGNARGGTVLNKAGTVDNAGAGDGPDTNIAGSGGTSITGDAFGGNSGGSFEDPDPDNDGDADVLAGIRAIENQDNDLD